MDYIMKLLEEDDEGEGMPAGVDVDALIAELSCQIAGNSEPSPPICSNTVQFSGSSESVQTPIIGQKKLFETSSPPSSSKKQKVSGGSLDLSINQLNDVTAISGINLGIEEEHLLSGSKKESRHTGVSRTVVREEEEEEEEEERLILQRPPLQKKLEGIMLKYGVTSISNDVEKCLSMCVEERVRQIIRNSIRQSKQRTDINKPKDMSFITSDIRQQILLLNQKSKEEWGKKQAGFEKIQKLGDNKNNPATRCREEKEEGHGKANKANIEENKMRTRAANAAVRAAMGGIDIQSKWQLMAEQESQKHGGSSAAVSSSPTLLSGNGPNKIHDSEMMCNSTSGVPTGSSRKLGKVQAFVTPTRGTVDRAISVKDVIYVLEREPQMVKSPLVYRLYNKVSNTNNKSTK